MRIDGSFGEGGGQILRSALALSMVTGREFRIDRIRANRSKPGLRKQHLTAVEAAAAVCRADVQGAALGSTALQFRPGTPQGGDYTFRIGTAGSTTLVMQTILLPLALARRPSRIVLEGGTHNPFAPPLDFLERAYVPLVNRMGPQVTVALQRYGFYPNGGGRIVVTVAPAESLARIECMERGPLTRRVARSVVSKLPRHIAEREIRVMARGLDLDDRDTHIVEVERPVGPGNVVMLELQHEFVTELFTSIGAVGRSAEAVATDVVQQCRRYLDSDAPVGEHLTDQLMLPMALAGAGAFRSTGLSLHAKTHLELIGKFLDVTIAVERAGDGTATVRFGAL